MWTRYRHPTCTSDHIPLIRPWLHGDDRGSIDREHNRYKTPYALPTRTVENTIVIYYKAEPVTLSAAQRTSIEIAVRDTCACRALALACFQCAHTSRSHPSFQSARKSPKLVLNAFKANATRQMREDGCWQHAHSPWAEKGSKRNLWNDARIVSAIELCDQWSG